jgi:hypothetical protein
MTDQLRRGADARPLSLSMVFNLTRRKKIANQCIALAEQHEQIQTRTGFPLVAKADRSELINRKPYDGFCEGIERAGFAIKCASFT